MKKVLILYATAGIGHKKAALAVKKAFDEMSDSNYDVKCEDALDHTNAFFKRSYLQIYLLMINKLPLVWGFFYYLTDNRFANIFISIFRRLNNWLNSGNLVKYLVETKPDIIISTHFFASEVISDMKRNGTTEAKLITIVTDYKLHCWWVSSHNDIFVVGSDYAMEGLLEWGVDRSKVRLLGIPVEPVFSKAGDKDNITRASGMEKGVFTVLVVGGGFGVGPIEEIIDAINVVDGKLQVIAVCGHNKALADKLDGKKASLKFRLKALGFVDNVYEYMEISDVLISKSGGITVAESLSKELPMIIISPILGQETRNSSFLTGHRAAITINKAGELKGELEALLSDRKKLEDLKDAIKEIRRPYACYDIAKLAISMAG